MTIKIEKNVYEFLASGLSTDKKKERLQHILVTDDQRLIATDGFRAHIVPLEEQYDPGYYTYIKSTSELIFLSADIGGSAMWSKDNFSHKMFYDAENVASMPVVVGKMNRISDHLSLPKISKAISKEKGKINKHTLIFRKGLIGGILHAICLGLDALPYQFDAEGNLSLTPIENCLILDAKYVQNALSNCCVRQTMKWDNVQRAVQFGDRDQPHAIVMPMQLGEWDYGIFSAMSKT